MERVADVQTAQERTGIAPAGAQEITADEFMRFTEEVRDQSGYRYEQEKCADYHDSNQMTAEEMAFLEQMRLPTITANLVAPTINVVLGMEVKTRLDWRVSADSSEFADVAEAQSQKLHEAERESRADRAISDAFAAQAKVGEGWVEVRRNSDPTRYRYKASYIHRREMFWSLKAQEPDLDDAAFLIRRKWFPRRQVEAWLPPEKRGLVEAIGRGYDHDLILQSLQTNNEGPDLVHAMDVPAFYSLEDLEWRDVYTDRLALYEVCYTRFMRGLVLRDPKTGRAVEFSVQNPQHVRAVSSGAIRPEPALYRKFRRSTWLGPYKVSDIDIRRNRWPYIPFLGFREDKSGVPYGLIRSMIPLQDEINARRRKFLWAISSMRLIMDSDALDTKANSVEEVLAKIASPAMVALLNPQRTNRDANAFRIENNSDIARQQFEAMQDAKQMLQEVAGIFNAFLGKDERAQSGLAISSLVEQATTGLGDLMDNYRHARQLVGEQLLSFINEDLSGQQVDVMVGEGARRRVISLNRPVVNAATGQTHIKNDISASHTKVALSDVPATPAYRQQQLQMFTEVLKGMPQNVQGILAPMFIELTDLPNRHDAVDELRKSLGLGKPLSKEEQDEADRQAGEQQAEAAAIQKEAIIAEVKKLIAEAMEAEGKARKAHAEADQIEQSTALAAAGEERAKVDHNLTTVKTVQEIAMQGKEQQKPEGRK